MPQKKNPDVLEIIRARCAKVIGNQSSATILLRGLATGYNLDYQELTPLVWESLEIVRSCLTMMGELVPKVAVRDPASAPHSIQFTAATELANLLVREEKIPFREAHHLLGKATKSILASRENPRDLTKADWERLLNRKIGTSTYVKFRGLIDPLGQVEVYRTRGSPSANEVKRMISDRTRNLKIIK